MEQNKWKVEIKASNMENRKHQDYIYLKKKKIKNQKKYLSSLKI